VRKRYIFGGGILLLVIGYLLYLSLGSSVSYYLTVNELEEKSPEIYNTHVRVIGKVADNSIKWDADEISLEFIITESNATIPVVYRGTPPDGFSAGANVLVDGEYLPEKIFRAKQILMKCPSKYEPVE